MKWIVQKPALAKRLPLFVLGFFALVSNPKPYPPGACVITLVNAKKILEEEVAAEKALQGNAAAYRGSDTK